MRRAPLPSRICATCGRSFQWRRKWARDWESVRYCSDRCRRHPVNDQDRRIEETIMEMLQSSASTASICPSEVARRVSPRDWEPLTETVRQAARRLVARGDVVITSRGRIVDPDRARGPIRIRLSGA